MRVSNCCVLGCACLFSTPAYPHENWISREKFRDPQTGDWCCNAHDCHEVSPDQVWHQRDSVTLKFPFEGVKRDFEVPNTRILPSRDGKYWVCISAEATARGRGITLSVRCFFEPLIQ